MMNQSTCCMIRGPLAAAALFFTSLLGNPAYAKDALKEALAADIGVEIVRDATELAAELRPRPIDHDVADTALIFTNFSSRDLPVYCVAFNKNGEPIGRRWVKLPALGLRYLLASDLSGGRDFVGHAQCSSQRHVRGSAIFLGPQLTDLPVQQGQRTRFPVVATY